MTTHTLLLGLLNVALFVVPACLLSWTDAPKRRSPSARGD
jgi:hypothetical protein